MESSLLLLLFVSLWEDVVMEEDAVVDEYADGVVIPEEEKTFDSSGGDGG